MLTTSISETKPGIRFAIKIYGVDIATFIFPLIYPPTFDALLAGKNCWEQDDDGFFVSLKDGIVTIKIDTRDSNGADEYTVFTLPLEVCRPAFVEIQPIMKRLWPVDD